MTAFTVSLSGPLTARAQEPPPPPGEVAPEGDGDDEDRTPPRLSFARGEVSFWRPGAEDWTQAQINLPLGPGDALYTGQTGSLELEIGPRAFIRAGAGTQLSLENQEPDFLQFKVTAGHVAVDVRDIERGHTIEIDTPNAAFAVEENGYYRIDISDNSSTFVARRSGRGVVTPAEGEPRTVSQNEQIVIEGIDTPTVQTYAAADLDAWDRWNYERTDGSVQTKSARYVPPGVYGTRDLDEYGSWGETSDYGPVWTPRHVAADWAPYSDGRWVWDVSFGWSWVDNAAWGWAPSHYGRWVHVRNRWGWAPGPIIAAPVYAPAVVAFFGNSHVSVSIGVGAPTVGWVALGWGEPVVPWWGHRYHGEPSWRGWGGPRVVNRTVINNTTIVNVNNINVYQNARVRNAVIAERQDRFGRGDSRHVRVRAAEIEHLQPVRGNLDVRPVAASLSPRQQRGVRPPDEIVRRPVVATRQPRDPDKALRAQGIAVPNNNAKPMSAPRIVRSARPAPGGAAQAPREQADPRQQAAPQSAPRQQPNANVQQAPQPAPRVGRTGNLPRKEDQPGRSTGADSARPAPPAPAAGVRRPAHERNADGVASEANPQAPGKQARPQDQKHQQVPPPIKQAAPQNRPQQASPQEQAAPRVEQPAPHAPPQQARPKHEQQQRQAAPRVEQPVPHAPPQQARPQHEQQQRQAAPRVEQPAPKAPPKQARPQHEPQQRQAAPRVEQPAPHAPPQQAQPQREKQQRQAAPRVQQPKPQVRSQQPQPRHESPPEHAERPQQAPAAQPPAAAGDAPAKHNAPASSSKHDRNK